MTIPTKAVEIVEDEPQREKTDYSDDPLAPLCRWIVGQTEAWRQWRDANYHEKWNRYERLWRGVWDAGDRLRQSERSQVVTPALAEAVENAAAELEEAVFGRGFSFFDVTVDEAALKLVSALQQVQAPAGEVPGLPAPPTVSPEEQAKRLLEAIAQTRDSLKTDLQRSDFSANVVEIILYSAVFGTGFGEIVVGERAEHLPLYSGGQQQLTVQVPMLRALSPRAVLVDPAARRLDDGLGVAVEERVPRHILLGMQKTGGIRVDVALPGPLPPDNGRSGLSDVVGGESEEGDSVRVLRWYGKVPRALLMQPEETTEPPDEDAKQPTEYSEPVSTVEYDETDLVEAIVVIANNCVVLKAVENPYPNRPVTTFAWDVVPGRLYGRGICEKGEMAQRVLDAEVRARLDNLSLTTTPMVGLDVLRIPKNMKFEVRPGATVLTEGDPESAIRPIKLGQLDPNHWQNATALQAMVHQATGSIDASALAQAAGNARSGAFSMALAPIIKRYKRTLVRFMDGFLMPTLERILCRARMMDPKRYPPAALKLQPASTMGIMQREFETAQLTSLLATIPPGTPEHRAVLLGIVQNLSISNREQIIATLTAPPPQAAAQQAPNPLEMAAIEAEMREKAAKVRKLEAEAAQTELETALMPAQLQIEAAQTATKGIYNAPEGQQQDEFKRRMEILDRIIKLRDIEEKAADRLSNERITAAQMQASAAEKAQDRRFKAALELAKARTKRGGNGQEAR